MRRRIARVVTLMALLGPGMGTLHGFAEESSEGAAAMAPTVIPAGIVFLILAVAIGGGIGLGYWFSHRKK